MEKVIDINRIRREVATLALEASVDDLRMQATAQVIHRQPIGEISGLVQELLPGPESNARALSRADAASSLAVRLHASLEIAERFVAVLASVDVEFFEVTNHGIGHFSGSPFWTCCLLAVDRENGSCVSLALGVSD